MTHRRPTSSLALASTAALLLGSVATLALSSSAQAASQEVVTVTLPAASGTPGKALTGTVSATLDGNPVPSQTVTLTVDHGFFTDGTEKTPSTQGARAGNLKQSGTTITGTTASDGTFTFKLGIERDAGFDDDGRVAAGVTAKAGTATGQGTAAWSSADPINGGSVDVALSAFQEHPVSPTVSGDRTYYDVVARDQYGNAVLGAPIQIFPSPTTSYSYSDDFVSNVDALGDFWVTSDVPGTITTDVVWTDARTYTYTGTSGQAANGPTKDVHGSAAASFYDVSFNQSTYTISSSADGNVAVGTTVTKTVTVTDQLGRPVRGLDVQFFRFGPEGTDGNIKANRETNSLGQASYSYVGAGAGTGKVTAVVSDGLSRRTLTSENGFRFNVAATLSTVKAKAKGAKGGKGADDAADDVLKIKVDAIAAGADISVYRVTGSGTLKAVKATGDDEIGKAGKATVEVKDKNGKKATRYVVVVQQTPTTFSATTAPAKVR